MEQSIRHEEDERVLSDLRLVNGGTDFDDGGRHQQESRTVVESFAALEQRRERRDRGTEA